MKPPSLIYQYKAQRMASSVMLRRVAPVRQEPHGVNIPEDAILHSHRRENLKTFTLYSTLLVIVQRAVIKSIEHF
jgi:hypothetical protein